MDIIYDVADTGSTNVKVSVAVSTNGGATYTLPATLFSGNGYGTHVTPGRNKQIVWNAGADWNGKFSANVRFQVTADDTPPSDLALYISRSLTTTSTAVSLHTNRSFFIRWQHDPFDTCSPTSNPTGWQVTPSGQTNSINWTAVDVNSLSGFVTANSGTALGYCVFTVTCNNTNPDGSIKLTKVAQVTLSIISSSGGEH